MNNKQQTAFEGHVDDVICYDNIVTIYIQMKYVQIKIKCLQILSDNKIKNNLYFIFYT